jgi:ferrochelatase
MKTAVIISNMGGPHSLDSVERYLYNIFMDPDIIDIPLPGFLRKRFIAWFAKKRAPESTEIYRKIGGKTPLTDITNQQATLLEGKLNESGLNQFKVFVAMRYWYPFVEETWEEVIKQGFKKLIIVTLYPFYSTTTTGSLVSLIKRLNVNNTFPEENITIIDRYGDHPMFIKGIVNQILETLAESKGLFRDLMLSAHSIPMARIKKGDPYRDEIEKTVALIKEQLPADIQVHLCYQSKVGPIQWLSPQTDDTVIKLAEQGLKNLLAYPLGFVADNSETIYEIGMLYKDLAEEKGITNFKRIDSLNTRPEFIDTLSDVVLTRFKEKFA